MFNQQPFLKSEIMRPDLEQIQLLKERLGERLPLTPVIRCPELEIELGDSTRVSAKLEFLQRTGTFKARGALTVILGLSAAQKSAGVTAVSAGNHAIAVAFAASVTGISAKVVMTASANPERVRRAREFGAEIVFAEDVHSAFDRVARIREEEGRFLVHPFEGEQIALGTATLGLEIAEQVPDADLLILPVGGGGLCAGVASAVRLLNPGCEIVGVEPEGADSMYRSVRAGAPQTLDRVTTIADSLGAPFAMPYSFELCRDTVDDFLRISDEEIRRAMRFLFRRMRMAVEPACAATTAALLGPARQRAAGRRVVILLCGSNIDWPTFATLSEL